MDLHSDFATININTIILVVSVSVFACFMWYFSTKLNTHLKGLESSKESQILFDMCLNAGNIGTWQYDIKHDILLWSQGGKKPVYVVIEIKLKCGVSWIFRQD